MLIFIKNDIKLNNMEGKDMNKIFLFIFLLFIFCFSVVYGDNNSRIAVFNFRPMGISDNTAIVSTQLFRGELANTGKFTVIELGEMEKTLDTTQCYDVMCASELSNKLNASKAVIGSISQLGKKIIVNVRLINVADSQVEFTDQFSATSIEDLDVVMRKLAIAVSTRRTIESSVKDNVISDEETKGQRKRKTFTSEGFKFGFIIPIRGYADVKRANKFEGIICYEPRSYMVETISGILWGAEKIKEDTVYDRGYYRTALKNSVVDWYIDVGIKKFLANERSTISPYIGGDLGFHIIGGTKVEDDKEKNYGTSTSPAIAGNIGVLFFRDYDFRVLLDTKYNIIFSDNLGTSQGIGISIGINYIGKRCCGGLGCLY